MFARLLLCLFLVTGLLVGQTVPCVSAKRCVCCPAPGESSCCAASEVPAEPASPALATQSGVDRAITLPVLLAILPREALRDVSPTSFDFAPNRCLSAHARRDLLCIRLI